MDLDAITRLMERAEQSAFSRIEIQQGDFRILLERNVSPAASAHTAAQQQFNPAEPSQPDDRNTVRSPISGVFYLAKEPGAAPFVQVGSRVNKGDTLCIIEAMKTMNEIRAPRIGVVTAIFASDGATLAAGDPMFLLSEGN
ncbi:Biotin carboxyl carrier protein of acetyl-CoA carboxylase [bioreactor metagenome]|uniref:Biotin carboxyl carrier protein of acetyl-CoA carboxylase n=1 Tax=bioreactor metagenome TaxID=1076179 RepID=A0A644X012_9ZZZZ